MMCLEVTFEVVVVAFSGYFAIEVAENFRFRIVVHFGLCGVYMTVILEPIVGTFIK